MGGLSLLPGIFLTQESNRGLLRGRQILYHLSYSGSPVLHNFIESQESGGVPNNVNFQFCPMERPMAAFHHLPPEKAGSAFLKCWGRMEAGVTGT